MLSSKTLTISIFITCSLLLLSVSHSPNDKDSLFPDPIYIQDTSARINEMISLGQMLFYDPILSQDSTIACASCHSPYQAFAHTDHALSHGINDKIGKRNAPALFNLAWQKQFMWDGAIHHLEVQALAPINNPDEMGENTLNVIKKLMSSKQYHNAFYQAFGTDSITGERMLKALTAFELSLVSATSTYDLVQQGKAHFSPQQSAGYLIYKKHCRHCHPEPLFFKNEFLSNGLMPDSTLRDSGRYQVTGKVNDLYRFKIPSLRNLRYTYPYMHDGRFRNLQQVIRHYSDEEKNPIQLPVELKKKMALTAVEKTDLIAFLLCLNDSSFLFNPNHQYPRHLLNNNE